MVLSFLFCFFVVVVFDIHAVGKTWKHICVSRRFSSPHWEPGLPTTPHPQPRDPLAGPRQGSPIRCPPPQRMGGQPLQQTRPAHHRLRLSVQQQQHRHGPGVLAHPGVPLESAPLQFPSHSTERRVPGPRAHLSDLHLHQDGRQGLHQVPSAAAGRHEDGELQPSARRPRLHERPGCGHPSPHPDLPGLLPAAARVRRQPLPPGQSAGRLVIQLHSQVQKQSQVELR